jgi:hypothetical protein
MSVVLTVPVLGAVCSMLCEPNAGMRVPRLQAAAAHHKVPDGHAGAHHHAHSASVDRTAADQHHAAPATVSDTPRPPAGWNGRCCDQPTLTLAAIPVVRHDLRINPAVFDAVSVVLDGSEVRLADVRRDTSRAPSPPGRSNPVLRI